MSTIFSTYVKVQSLMTMCDDVWCVMCDVWEMCDMVWLQGRIQGGEAQHVPGGAETLEGAGGPAGGGEEEGGEVLAQT